MFASALASNSIQALGLTLKAILTFRAVKCSTGCGLIITFDTEVHVPRFATSALLAVWKQLLWKPAIVEFMRTNFAWR